MSKTHAPPTLTSESGAPIADTQRSKTAGPNGPTLLEDHHLIEKLARFNRERIPERVVHAVGSGAYGRFVVTHPNAAQWTRTNMFNQKGKETELFARFSTVAGGRGAPDAVRDPRGFSVKFYTEDGNWDLVGNNTPIFFLRDGIKFPDFIHSQKSDPLTNQQEPNNVWDFFSLTPEATHQFVWLFGDRGIPASYRQMDGFGSHTFLWENAQGERFYVKFHFKTDQGIRCLTSAEAQMVAGRDQQAMQSDLFQAIARGDYPSWTLKVQVMPEKEANTYRYNPFDLTKVWPYADYPLIEIGKMTLDRNPENYFEDVEQSAFDPGHFVDGIGPSPDRMLQARLFAYGDAHRYRLGINHTHLPVNQPKGVTGGAQNYGRDGFMASGGGSGANYFPNSRGGPVPTGKNLAGEIVSGRADRYDPESHPEDDDFVQAGALYQVMDDDARSRLVENIAASLAKVTLPSVVDRAIGHFENADVDLGSRLRERVAALTG
jgi:catalase